MQKRIAILVAMDKEYDLLHNMLNIKEVALDEKKEMRDTSSGRLSRVMTYV